MLIAGVAALLLAAPAIAKDPVFVTSAPVKDKPGAIVLSPTTAYVLLRSDAAMPLYIMKLPSAEDQATYDGLRTAALAKARSKYLKKQKEYDAVIAANAALPKGTPRTALPDRPVEPTEANFEFTPFPLLAGVAIGPLNRFAKASGGLSTYLQELTPGEYRIYGPLAASANGGMMGNCFCMGSVAFIAKAGEIVDLGMVTMTDEPIKRPAGDSSAPMLRETPFLVPATADTVADPRLAAARIVPARFRPVGKLPNYFGVTIARMPALPGVMRYDRDRIVDLTAGQ